MNNRVVTSALALVALTGSLLAGCKEDPPPPPLPEPKGTVKFRDHKKALKTPKMSNTRLPKISAETMKRFRVELCRYGSYGLKFASDAYTTSLAGAVPSAGKLPTFGKHPDGSRKSRLKGRAAGIGRALPFYGQLPFARHVRACTIAKGLREPATPALSEALVAFDAFAAPLNKHMMEALRYYGRKQFEKDKFARAQTLHKHLSKLFPQIDTKLAAVDTAAEAWLSTLKKQPEKLDESGELVNTALNEARGLLKLAMAESVDAAAFKEATSKLAKAVEAIHGQEETKTKSPETAAGVSDTKKKVPAEKKDAGQAKDKPTATASSKAKVQPKGKVASPFARVVTPQLKKLLLAAEKAQGAIKNKKLTVADRYGLSLRMATALEANHQALGQLLRLRGDTKPGGPLRLMKPRLRANTPRPRIRPRPKVD